MMPVVLATFDEVAGVRCIRTGVEQLRFLHVVGDAVSTQIGDMGYQRR